MHNILLASKISYFKCKDLLEIIVESEFLLQSLTSFRLDKAIKEIVDLI